MTVCLHTEGNGTGVALGSAGAIRTFPVQPGVEALTIFADHDPAGMDAAKACGARAEKSQMFCPGVRGELRRSPGGSRCSFALDVYTAKS
jgi:hypothetical protein